MDIDNKLLNNIQDYCKLNEINDIDKFINELLNIGLTVKKFGTSPYTLNQSPKAIESQEPTNNQFSSKTTIRIINH